MYPLRKILVSALVLALSGIFAPAIIAAPAAVAAAPENPTFRQFDNGRIRIGSGAGEASVTATGVLRGPQYHSPDGNWYNLTIGNNTLDSAIGVGGDGTSSWNLNGAILEGSVSGVTFDYSEFVATEARGTGAIGYGSITSTGTTTVNGAPLRVTNRYTLEAISGFIRVTTSVTNLGEATATNIRTWVGTRDDWIGNSDASTKQRGSLTTTEFVASTSTSERSPAIKISTGSEGALFYSTSPRANTQIAGCCSFSNAYRADPLTNATQLYGDGSYALFVRLDDLALNQSDSYTWYYAAGEISTLTETISEVAQAAATWSDQSVTEIAENGQPYSDGVSASGSGGITYSVLSGNLPDGIVLDAESGTIAGTPTVNGTYTFVVRATAVSGDSTATSDSPELSITVGERPSFIDLTVLPLASANIPLADGVEASGYPAPTYSIVDGALPTGLSLNPVTGAISGTPTVRGASNFSIMATNALGSTETPNLSIAVTQAPRITSIDGIPVRVGRGIEFSGSASTSDDVDGFVVCSGTLPPGITLNSVTGMITGSATANGTYSFVLRAANADGFVDSDPISITVGQAPVADDGTVVSHAHSAELFIDGVSASGYPLPTYSISDGALPEGVTLNESTGEITGTPAATGVFNFTVTAANEFGQTTLGSFELTITEAPGWTDSELEASILRGVRYTDSIVAHGTPSPTYSVASGMLPAGLTLNTATGELSGTPTRLGEYSFSIAATGEGYRLTTEVFEFSIEQSPEFTGTYSVASLIVGDSLADNIVTTAWPAATFALSGGRLPAGVTLSPTTGALSGVPTETGTFPFTVLATNARGSAELTATIVVQPEPTPIAPETPETTEPAAESPADTTIEFDIPIGIDVVGAPVVIHSSGLAPGAPFTITVRSTPQVVGAGSVNDLGEIGTTIGIPGNLEPGWHSITVDSTSVTGEPSTEVIYFEITESQILESISSTPPTPAEEASSLTDDDEFYAEQGIDPSTIVTTATVNAQVAQVATVVASVALVSAVAGAAGAAAAAGAAGAAGSSAGSARSMSARGTTSASSSSGSGATHKSAESDTAESEEADADYGNLEADHDDFAHDESRWGDRLGLWKFSAIRAVDHLGAHLAESTSTLSPVLSRIINDGSYLRAMLGSISVLPYIAALILGVLAVDPSAENLAASALVVPMIAIVVLGVVDAFAGLIGVIALTITSVIVHPIVGLGDVRYLLSVFILGFAPIILATTFRKIRREPAGNRMDVWERIVDIALIAFIASLTTVSLVSGVPAFAGASVPLADHTMTIVVWVTAVAVARIGLEELAAAAFTARLDAVNPTEVSGPGIVQQWVSLAVKYAVLVIMIGDMVGWGWHLWVGAAVIFLPGLLSLTLPELPTFAWITQVMPGGLAALLAATLIGNWSTDSVTAVFGALPNFDELSFVLIPLPVILMAVLGMFASEDDKWYRSRGLNSVYVLGGIVVFAATFWITDFIGSVTA
ncbi:MAG: Ig domain-containing protein [Microbacteriaceae bacterium]